MLKFDLLLLNWTFLSTLWLNMPTGDSGNSGLPFFILNLPGVRHSPLADILHITCKGTYVLMNVLPMNELQETSED